MIDQSSLPYDSICSFTNDILNIVLLRYVEGDLSRATACSGCARHYGGLWDVLRGSAMRV